MCSARVFFYKDKLQGKQDVLLIDEDGDFHPMHLPKKGELSDTIGWQESDQRLLFRTDSG